MKRREFIAASLGALSFAASRRASAQSHEVDVVVIGAGSSGCALVHRLTSDPSVRVVLIEAGPSPQSNPAVSTPGRWVSLMGSSLDWKFTTEPEPGLEHRTLAFPRGKAVGGCSAINAMTYIRGHRLDFDGWRARGNAGWGYDDVLPSFRRVEDNSRGASEFRGANGPLRVADGADAHAGHHAFLAAARARGFEAAPDWDFHQPALENGAGFYQKNIKDGRRHSAADAFLASALARPNLDVVTEAQVTRLLVDRTRVVGVEYMRNGERARVHASEVVLCGGVVASPQMLMLSGIGPADHLRALGLPVVVDLPGVGANLQDHLKLSVRWQGKTTLPPSTVTAGLFVHSVAPGSTRHGAPDLQFYVGRGTDRPDAFITITASLVRPYSRGEIRLRSADPFAAPIIRGAYLSEPRDVAALVEGVRLARALAATAAYDALRGEELEPGPSVTSTSALEAFARRASDTIYHPAGTCRMGNDGHAVVDATLRVRGVEGLRIADASVMPDVVSATTHAACVMIGDRAAEFMLRD